MYQPRRLSTAEVAERPVVDAFHAGPRRAARGRAALLGARIAPAAVSVTLLATASGVAVSIATPNETTAVPAPVREDDQASRAQAQARATVAPETTEAPEATPVPLPTAEPTANAAFATTAWADAFGAVSGEKYTQASLNVRAQASSESEKLGTLKEGEKVKVTDKVVGEYVQIAYGEKVGWIISGQIGDEPPAKDEPAVVGMAEVGPGEVGPAKNGTLYWPTAGKIGSPWGMRKHPILGYSRMHGGVDIGGRSGQPIYAAESGVVTGAAYGYNGGSGNNVRIKHGKINGKNVETQYLHMSNLSVKVGQKVTRGQVIGTVGSTGLSTGPHLHFTVYANGTNSNPAAWLG